VCRSSAGHLPHIENPDAVWAAIDPFLAGLQPDSARVETER
jgi:hypothetical protein